ncbi:phosphohydrolase [Clostridium tetani]|uniref:bis(5'-nucleosyl)-tetraphosphatase (symmetrical) n=1 Tax=Clostridium tetani TaxID=1513 RepID=A0ABY0EMB4_CLOTA|nr:bis(5'-nucleosyl)-tetraphosphatase (symmetrical) YqeK [Clostridium tetani]KHO38252.1 phosphohydrolase [Clostridium tetani]RXI53544.1 HD domain-containing protein [Clostridium tetani]RXI66829.1 HD domain-containing protein [Clostridium tetani]
MWSEEEIEDYLKKNLKEKRFLHSLRVKDMAIKMAKFYNIDIEKTKMAALIHDCAKNKKNEELINIVKKYGYDIDKECEKNIQLLHGLVGTIIAKNLMGIKDQDILNAIRYHTTGRENMTMLEKIIYLSDYIEPGRKYPGVEKVRELAFQDIDKALINSFNITIKYVIEKDQVLHLDTIKGRNFLLKNSR